MLEIKLIRSKKGLNLVPYVILAIVLVIIISIAFRLLVTGKEAPKQIKGFASEYLGMRVEESETAPSGPLREGETVLESAYIYGNSVFSRPYSTDESGAFQEVACEISMCSLVLDFDRQIKVFPANIFEAKQWDNQNGKWVDYKSQLKLTFWGARKDVMQIDGFENEKSYFVRLNPDIELEDASTNKKVKISKSNSVMKFKLAKP